MHYSVNNIIINFLFFFFSFLLLLFIFSSIYIYIYAHYLYLSQTLIYTYMANKMKEKIKFVCYMRALKISLFSVCPFAIICTLFLSFYIYIYIYNYKNQIIDRKLKINVHK